MNCFFFGVLCGGEIVCALGFVVWVFVDFVGICEGFGGLCVGIDCEE